MAYEIHKINNAQEISHCPICEINKYIWGGDYRPNAYGQIALLGDSDLCVHMWAEESEPATTYTQNQDPVYLDSALEFFLKSSTCDNYYNFEVNSKGALLAQCGTQKDGRAMLSPALMSQITCKSWLNQNQWHICLTLPMNILGFNIHEDFRFNFYKIKESSGLTHFASYAPLSGDMPNFHQPKCFVRATISNIPEPH